MPARYRTRLRYADNLTLTTGTLQLFGSEYTYRLNSLYDPDFASTGHQPLGFDQLSVWYDKYLVTRVNVELTITDPSQDGLAFAAAIRPTSAAGSIQSVAYNVAAERPGVMVKCINDTGDQVKTINFDLPMHEVFGVTRAMYAGASDAYGAQIAANPTLVSYFSMAAINLLNTTNASVRVLVRMTFDAEFFERKPPTQS